MWSTFLFRRHPRPLHLWSLNLGFFKNVYFLFFCEFDVTQLTSKSPALFNLGLSCSRVGCLLPYLAFFPNLL